ncbi:hypothetical protein H2C43_07080 [Corynebacterium glutamicum]|uniref:Uncharacterized protein n=1 Tax=Corynebacterium glutamicum (strain ATCC 13032 / DSM 20300 / JCM 1318 / BCRC 11384 / CCUG 27702 / LMG 3730 / NBRC 12168 / NCIMB 10025 / NRRL B-2784 / 534) TaxID=196627 RepID=Q8NPG4_CORGL|nr:hypothetical protein [Corynebacterium glutamicum]AUI01330.1 hypothetical protein CYL77_09350 [Corynebacterium glutamicum]AUI04978.1 hypothetical protein C0I99_13045 [Corynebacterium glutamicum]MBA4571770.1 hypothetical protein [Corynebacterium glutamicum]MBA4574705.1 hypothetical protein [Corynebacterium glutamicum]MBA4577634.1 hypothetical protein [Corynebacterium glutamicum]
MAQTRTAGEIIKDQQKQIHNLAAEVKRLRERDDARDQQLGVLNEAMFSLLGDGLDRFRESGDEASFNAALNYQAVVAPEMFKTVYGVDPSTGEPIPT